MNSDNPAVQQALKVPPAILDAVEKDGSVLEGYARKFLTVQLSKLNMMAKDPDISVGQAIAIAEFTAKIARMGQKESLAAGAGNGAPAFTLTINVPTAPPAAPTTVDVTPKVIG